MRVRNRKQRGFSLMEVLVSFAILSLSLITLFRTISDGTRNITVVENKVAALALARSKMESVGYEIPLQSGESTGVASEGFQWTLNITPYQPVATGEQKLNAYWVSIYVVSTKGRRKTEVRLKTLKIGAANG